MLSVVSNTPPRHLGLTWDHPRGYLALDVAARDVAQPGDLLHWHRQPLEGFESHPIGELAAKYDLLVMDHPHIGEAVELDCLVPLEELFSAEQLAQWAAQSVGNAMKSYEWHGRHWALPLDVATQVMAYRADLLPAPPQTWSEVLALSAKQSVALSVAGPHAFLSLLSIAAGLGEALNDSGRFLSTAVFAESFGTLRALYARTSAATHRLNPIGLLEAMSTGDEIALVPLIYGYATYSRAQPGRKVVSFTDAPASSSGCRSTVLGGTGIAITRRALPDAALLDHLTWLMSEPAQTAFFPAHEGQPSHRGAWQVPAVNAPVAQFYRATLQTTTEAFVRPRFDGYITFQNQAAALVRTALESGTDAAQLDEQLRHLWQLAWAQANARNF